MGQDEKEKEFVRVSDWLTKAIERLWERDLDLFSRDVNERSITHRLAVYLEQVMPVRAYHCDCEFNRQDTDPKRLNMGRRELQAIEKELTLGDKEGKTVYPDIIVHGRGDDDDNLLVVEVKKQKSSVTDTLDRKKLEAFTSDSQGFCYRWGVFLRIGSDDAALVWFRAGNEDEDKANTLHRNELCPSE